MSVPLSTIKEQDPESDLDKSQIWCEGNLHPNTKSLSTSSSEDTFPKPKELATSSLEMPSKITSVYLVQRQDIQTRHGRSKIHTDVLCGRSTATAANEVAQTLAKDMDDKLLPTLRQKRALTVDDKGNGLYRAVIVTKCGGKGVVESSVVFEVKEQNLFD